MLQKPEEINVPADDPFANDDLERKVHVERVVRMLASVGGHSFVLSVNGRWGAGKTTFVRMARAKLISARHGAVYLNAWENDFVPDPLMAVIGAMEGAIADGTMTLREGEDDLWRKFANRGEALLDVGLSVAVKAATAGVVDYGAVKQAASQPDPPSATAATKEAPEPVRSRLAEFVGYRDLMKKFKDELSDLLATDTERAPTVVIVDELDRCRPTFALELLERIKHFFDVPGLAFLIAVDREQLAHMVCAVYGQGMDAEGYLRRFIDLDFNLPDASASGLVARIREQLELDQVRDGTEEVARACEMLAQVSDYLGLMPRDVEQVATRLNLVLRLVPENMPSYPDLLALLVSLRHWRSDLYEAFLQGEVGAVALGEEFEKKARASSVARRDGHRSANTIKAVRAWLWTCTRNPGELSTYQSLLERKRRGQESFTGEQLEKLEEMAGHRSQLREAFPGNEPGRAVVAYARGLIEATQHFDQPS